jgi:hypothetical protein
MNRPGDSTEGTPNRDVQPADHAECASICPVELVVPEPDYAAFGRWVDAELEKLVAEYGPTAAPAAKHAAARAKFGRQ